MPRVALKPPFFVGADLRVRPLWAHTWVRPYRQTLLLFLILACFCLGWGAPPATYAGDNLVTVYLFWTEGCPHCLHEKEFLAALEQPG